MGTTCVGAHVAEGLRPPPPHLTGCRAAVQAMLSLQPDLKLGVFVAMSGNATGAGTGFDDAVVFGTAFDLVPGVQSALASLAQLPAAPPSPEVRLAVPVTHRYLNLTQRDARSCMSVSTMRLPRRL